MIVEEPKDNNSVQPADTSVPITAREELTRMSNFLDDIRYLRPTSTVPATKPTNPLNKFVLYINGATKKLYIWDNDSSTWLAITLD